MLSSFIHRSFKKFSLTKYSEDILKAVFPTAPQLNKPQVIDTEAR